MLWPSFKRKGRKKRAWAGQRRQKKIHITLYGNAKGNAKGEDVKVGDIYICSEFCGYTAEGQAPDKCPLCGATRTSLRNFN